MKKIYCLLITLMIFSLSMLATYAHTSSQGSIIAFGDDVGWSIDEGAHTNGNIITFRFEASVPTNIKDATRNAASLWKDVVTISETLQPTQNVVYTFSEYNTNQVAVVDLSECIIDSNGHFINWKLKINAALISSYSSTKLAAIIAHELGHVIGLNDLYYYGNSNNLMYGRDNGTATIATTADKNGASVITGKHVTHSFTSYPRPGITACSICGAYKKPASVNSSYEAESSQNTLSGSRVYNKTSCSGGKVVGVIGGPASGSVQFNNVAVSSSGNYTLKIHYLSGETRSARIKINYGTEIKEYFSGNSWDSVATKELTVYLNSGYNTIKIYNISDWAPDIDRITLTTLPILSTYEAESNSNLLLNKSIVIDKPVCSGEKAVGMIGGPDNGGIRFCNIYVNTSGYYTMRIYYVSGETRSAKILCNGKEVEEEDKNTVSFPGLSNWNTVGTKDVKVYLVAGSANEVIIYNLSSWAPDIDKVYFFKS